MSSGRLSEFAVGVAAPVLVIAAYAAKLGIPIGAMSTVVAAIGAGAAFPLVDRFVLLPLFRALGLDSDKLLMQCGRGAINAGLGLAIAMWALPVPLA